MKSILVIDTPENCGKCRLADFGECRGSKSYIHMPTKGRPKECPLRPLPEKKPVSYHDDLYGDVEKNYTNIGWNLCLEVLEK